MPELLARRTAREKHFDNGDGTFEARFYSHDVHYQDASGDWQEWSGFYQDVPGGVRGQTADRSIGIVGGRLAITWNGKSITLKPAWVGMVDRTAPGTRWRKLADADYTTVTRDRNVVTVHDIFPNTDLTVTLNRTGFSKAFTIRQRPVLPDPLSLGWDPANTFLVIVWDTSVPGGATVVDSVTGSAFANGYVGHNDLDVKVAGQTVFTLKAGHGTSAVGVKNPVWYVRLGAQVPFGEAYAYGKAATATYPLVLDPTTTINVAASGDDGHVYSVDGGTTWAWASTGDASLLVGHDAGSNPGCDWCKPPDPGSSWNDAYISFLRFNLSSLSGNACSAASLNLYASSPTSPSSDTGSASILSSDFGTLSTTTPGAAYGNTVSLTVPAAVGWTAPSFSASAVGAKFGGYIAFRLEYWPSPTRAISGFASMDYAGTASDPYLSITYSDASTPSAGMPKIRMMKRVWSG